MTVGTAHLGRWAAALAFSLGLLGCTEKAGEPVAMARIEGAVFYRERIALPPHAQVEIQLEDVSRADALAQVLATVTLDSAKGPPYAFFIEYNPDEIDPRMRYALRASIRVDGKLRFTTTEYTDPFSGNPVDVLVHSVGGG